MTTPSVQIQILIGTELQLYNDTMRSFKYRKTEVEQGFYQDLGVGTKTEVE